MWSSELFKAEARKAQPYAQLVAARLRGAGIGCTADPLTLRDSIEHIADYAGQQDIALDAGGYLEVKSKRVTFSDQPASFPYQNVLLKSVNGWDGFTVKPLAIVLVSRHTHKMLAVMTSTEPAWYVTHQFDRARGITWPAYSVDSSYLVTFTEAVEYLHTYNRRQTQ